MPGILLILQGVVLSQYPDFLVSVQSAADNSAEHMEHCGVVCGVELGGMYHQWSLGREGRPYRHCGKG